jgi:ribosomal protein L11 methyltransferase
MEKREKRWSALEILLDREIEEVITSTLWEEGTLGIMTAAESNDAITLVAYFDKLIDAAACREYLINALNRSNYAVDKLHSLALSEVPDEDWLKKWKEGYQPFKVGSRFLITPSWARPQLDEAERLIIEIDPGMAFGTGTHETTRLCLEALERYWRGGRLLDVGTGTGILAIGAARLYPGAFINACDIDEEAIVVASENLAINGVSKMINLAVGSAAQYRGGDFSLVIANLTADVIIPLLADLIACLARDGHLILSGILDTQQQQVCDALLAHKQKIVEITQAGEWVAIISFGN